MQKLVPGMKVRYLHQPEWGVGHLLSIEDEGAKARVEFPSREGGAVLVSTRQGALVPHQLAVGDGVRTTKGVTATITGEVSGGRGLRRYTLRLSNGEEDELPEAELRAEAPRPDSLTMLKEARVGDSRNFLLRRNALHLDDERRCDALGALLASRVMVKPHQIGVVQRVLSARRPRFILADEVGLGKTIEAGMIFSALRLAGLARRTLVVTPSHLTVQWLAELFHKFNQLFTLMDGERYIGSLKENAEISPWARFDKVVTSLELLSRGDEHRAGAGDKGAFWDLVIVDEAHHLKGEKAFAAVRELAKNSWGLLLLTATPMQLDPAEYHSLLTLVEPSTAPTLEGFEAQLSRQQEISSAVREVLEGKKAAAAVKALAARFPKDKKLATLTDKDALLTHLAETYSLSDRLIRNRRVVVGGFAERRLHRHPVSLTKAEQTTRKEVLDVLRDEASLRGAALSQLLRRLESSPAAFLAALTGTKALAAHAQRFSLPARDGKFLAFKACLDGIWKAEPAAKVLVFTEARETLDSVQVALRDERIEALAYHGDLPLIDRDRQVARFRDPDGPRVLLCTEVGGEGRNFQFAHHLVNYDLPWSPAAMEQRIGRLDRIGQTRPVDIHVFEAEGTLSADVLTLLADAIGVFGETVGGLDAVLEEVEGKLAELALAPTKERERYATALRKKVAAARAQTKEAYDPLLDLRSFDKPAVHAMVEKAQRRFHMLEEDEELEDPVEDAMWAVARDLDERLEETVTELARKVGIGVDTDEQVEAFQCAFHFGHELKVEALPGLSLLEDRTVLGSFWRETALEQEENEYFATGHPIVEALFGFLRDGPYGRNGVRYIEKRGPLKARGLELLFHIVPPEAEDTSVGARVPSRQLARFLDELLVHVAVSRAVDGTPKIDPTLLEVLETAGQSLKGDLAKTAFPELTSFVDVAVAEGQRAAQAELKKRAASAKKAIEAEREATLQRVELSLAHQGLSPERIAQELAAEKAHYQSLLDALCGLSLTLDSACAFVINR